MRSILLLILILMAGCGQSDAPLWIEVDEPYDSVLAKLETIEAKSLNGLVGILCSPRCEWYVLPDGTCLQVMIQTGANGTESLYNITLGEAGKGYGDKRVWMQQQQTVFDRYDLRLDLQSNQARAAED